MTWLPLVLSLVAGAQEPVEEPTPADDGVQAEVNEEGILEVVVWGEDAIRAALEAIEGDLLRMGYRRGNTRDNGDMVFKPPNTWMSRAIVSRDGTLSFTRPVVAYRSTEARQQVEFDEHSPQAREAPGGDYQGTSRDPGTEVVVAPRLYLLPSKKRIGAMNAKVVRELEPELRYYRAVVQETSFQESLFALPGRLDLLWTLGEPLSGVDTLDSPQARREAVLEYWATRADTPRGRLVCDTVELWLSETVQPSAHPVTAEEVERYNAMRSDGAQLSLATP